MTKNIKIGKKLIGEHQPCFIIAEAGVNHNGDMALAKKLIDAAKDAGADAVKFQTFIAEDVVTEKGTMAEYQKKNTGKEESQLDMIRKFELSLVNFLELKKYCDKKGILFLSTAHTQSVLDFVDTMVPAHKIGSGDITNFPFLKAVAKKKKPIIISFGMATMQETMEAIAAIKKAGNKKIIVLHCTTNYPCPIDQVNLRTMLTLKKEFGLPFGYSDHTEGIWVSVMAVAMGAQVLEKHFTLDKNLPGPDHKASLDLPELKELVFKIREMEKILGSFLKKPTASENRIKKMARKSIVANVDIPKGVKIAVDMLIIKRPGTGIESKHLAKIVGKKAMRDIKKDTLISWSMV